MNEARSRRIPDDNSRAWISVKSIGAEYAGRFSETLYSRRGGICDLVIGDFDIGVIQLDADREIILLLARDPEAVEASAADLVRLNSDAACPNDSLPRYFADEIHSIF